MHMSSFLLLEIECFNHLFGECSIFKEIVKMFSQSYSNISHSQQQYIRVPVLPHSHKQNSPFNFGCSNTCAVISFCSFICICLMANDNEHLFMYFSLSDIAFGELCSENISSELKLGFSFYWEQYLEQSIFILVKFKLSFCSVIVHFDAIAKKCSPSPRYHVVFPIFLQQFYRVRFNFGVHLQCKWACFIIINFDSNCV